MPLYSDDDVLGSDDPRLEEFKRLSALEVSPDPEPGPSSASSSRTRLSSFHPARSSTRTTAPAASQRAKPISSAAYHTRTPAPSTSACSKPASVSAASVRTAKSASVASVVPARAQNATLHARLAGISAEIRELDARRAVLVEERRGIEAQLAAGEPSARASVARHTVDTVDTSMLEQFDWDAIDDLELNGGGGMAAGRSQSRALQGIGGGGTGKGKGKERAPVTTDYFAECEWSAELKLQMRKVFKIQDFRLCQEGVCNANMDGRDIVCIMPTGGGKSLTYQLPAVLNPGITVVVSPLVALMNDQVSHLREIGVAAEMLTAATPVEERNRILQQLRKQADGVRGDRPIKLLYVTPERIAQSKSFMNILDKLDRNKQLARFTIDEAHCVSTLGADFRPDYKKLSVLRTHFPHVPILALSATCTTAVLRDLISVLKLRPQTDCRRADPSGTVYFSAPLYRPNLHYTVVPKSKTADKTYNMLTDWICTHHLAHSGIVYCLSKSETENVAKELLARSGGRIKTGVYHADIPEFRKTRLHDEWQRGVVQVVCATIAFGMGIDNANVRFVVHHTISKSLENYYQESGRAGRDGNDADCVLYYMPQDFFRFTEIVKDREATKKLHAMLRFSQELHECRQTHFARYFSSPSNAWADGAGARCEKCDNCKRPPETFETRDVTADAWRMMRVMQELAKVGEQATADQLGTLVTGAKDRARHVVLAGGKATVKKEDAKRLAMHLLLSGHLAEDYARSRARNRKNTIAYLKTSAKGDALARLSLDEVEAGRGERVVCTFLKTDKEIAKEKKKQKPRSKKGKEVAEPEPEEDEDEVDTEIEIYEDESDLEPEPEPAPESEADVAKRRETARLAFEEEAKVGQRGRKRKSSDFPVIDEGIELLANPPAQLPNKRAKADVGPVLKEGTWMFRFRATSSDGAAGDSRTRAGSSNNRTSSTAVPDNDVIDISSDDADDEYGGKLLRGKLTYLHGLN